MIKGKNIIKVAGSLRLIRFSSERKNSKNDEQISNNRFYRKVYFACLENKRKICILNKQTNKSSSKRLSSPHSPCSKYCELPFTTTTTTNMKKTKEKLFERSIQTVVVQFFFKEMGKVAHHYIQRNISHYYYDYYYENNKYYLYHHHHHRGHGHKWFNQNNNGNILWLIISVVPILIQNT